MPVNPYQYAIICEPFRAWNRLEPVPRRENFDQVLGAEVHDALWFLTRQWQFGEFKGEDTGSAIFAKVALESRPLRGYQATGGSRQAYDDSRPLEQVVEQIAWSLLWLAGGGFFMREAMAGGGVRCLEGAIPRSGAPPAGP
ncbi:MAG: hypothetical protein D6722_05460 [Bacteroidetes bacterium]|nr:MAG: hypothetical protein D6722_05460 [Bacteroidota bacterium]